METPDKQPRLNQESTFTETECLSPKKEQKRRPKPKDGTVLFCKVCGDRAYGYNFDAVTCESCKAFFRRNALKMKEFSCNFDGNCQLDPHSRKFCSGCRLRKCFTVGMKKEWILSDDQLSKRRQKRKDAQLRQSKESTSSPVSGSCNNISSTVSQQTDVYAEQTPLKYSERQQDSCPVVNLPPVAEPSTEVSSEPSTSEEATGQEIAPYFHSSELHSIKNLIELHESIFNSTYSESQAKKLSTPKNPNDLYNITQIFIKRFISFVKNIPEFPLLTSEDQIALLKGGIMEIYILRSAMSFNNSKNSWKFKTDSEQKSLNSSILKDTLGQKTYDDHITLIKTLNETACFDKTVLILLLIIELFSSDRPNLMDKVTICNAQEKYAHWLKIYLEATYPSEKAKFMYPRLLTKLIDVRTLGEFNSRLASTLDVSQLDPLLAEVLNLEQ